MEYEKAKPIKKYNGGNGATLCHQCRVIIETGFMCNRILCDKCEEIIKQRAEHTMKLKNYER